MWSHRLGSARKTKNYRYREHKDTNNHEEEKICLGDKSSKVLN